MSSRFRCSEGTHKSNIWIAFTDLMSNAFLILSLLLILLLLRSQFQSKELQDLKTKIQELTPEDAPPILIIPTTGRYQFNVGSAELPDPLKEYIQSELIPTIEVNYKTYKIDAVEIIGHTDGQPVSGQVSNLDLSLEPVLAGVLPQQQLIAGSNVDLGLMRSMSVVQAIRSHQTANPWLNSLQFRAYSAGQMMLPDGSLSGLDEPPNRGNQPQRRRIEIRFTRLGEEQLINTQ